MSGDDTLDLGADVRAMHEAEQSLAMQAFRSLPERWQAVLWHTTVEEESPSQVAPLFGLTPNATAVLAPGPGGPQAGVSPGPCQPR